RVVTIAKETLISNDAHRMGNENAAAYLVEFSDFQCPACAAFAPAVESLTNKYKDQFLFVYRHYPLPQYQYAKPAAYAAEAAALQGKFWEAVVVLFKNQDSFSDDFFSTQFIQLLKLNTSQYTKDIDDPAIMEKIERDLSEGQQLGLRSTPTFFLNGVLLTNLSGPNDLVKAVETAIKQ
ncbi:hypothetical protein A2994_02485, partial [candidate division Kazan bacterium RIFCSPLOWO2_01_FULL_48_13]